MIATIGASTAALVGDAGAANPAPGKPEKANYARPFETPTRPALIPLPPGAVTPEGWLRDWCLTMRDGYTGRMEDVHEAFKQAWSADFQMTGANLDWRSGGWPYEGGGYWFEGLTLLSQIMHDDRLIAHARQRFEPVISGMQTNQGILFFYWLDRNNPDHVAAAEGRNTPESEWPMWSSGLFGRALASHYEATRDPRALQALEQAYSGDPRWIRMGWAPSSLGPAYDTWTWTGNPKIRAALDAFFAQGGINGNIWSFNHYAKPPQKGVWAYHTDHVVHMNESSVWALGYLWTGKRDYLDAQLARYDLLARDGMLPMGAPVSDEFTGPPGAGRGAESCSVVGYLWSQALLMGISGQGRLGDRMERTFFNAAPAVVSRDCRSYVYTQRPNRAIDPDSQNRSATGWERTLLQQFSYRPFHAPLCCSASLNRMLPTYITRMWMATPDHGLALALHGPSRVKAVVADGVPVEISSRTAYPFDETIELTVRPTKTVAFPLLVRVPGWCLSPAITVAGADLTVKPIDGFARIQRTWQSGDVVRLRFPMSPQIETGRDVAIPGKMQHEVLAETVAARTATAAPYASVSYGPLLFSLPIAEGKDANTPAPEARWNFALDASAITVERDEMPTRWDWPQASPLRLRVKGIPFPWADATVLPGALVDDTTPAETLTLVPYGCTALRVSMFPVTNRYPPTLVAAVPHQFDRVVLTFSEPVQQVDAALTSNYRIEPNVKIVSVVPGEDHKTVTLTTSPLATSSLSSGEEYTLTVKNIRNCARKPNVVAPDTCKTFRYSPFFARWKLDEGKGLVAADAGRSKQLDGALKGGVTWTNAAGRTALSFNGADGTVEIPTKLEDLAVPFSFTFWVNPAAEQVEYADIFGNHGGSFCGLVMQQDGNKTNLFGFVYGDGKQWQVPGAAQLTAGQWQHVAVVCDGSNAFFYVNGELKSGAPCTGAFAPNTDLTFRMGQGFRAGRFFRGLLSDVRIYRTALSAAEVKAVMKD